MPHETYRRDTRHQDIVVNLLTNGQLHLSWPVTSCRSLVLIYRSNTWVSLPGPVPQLGAFADTAGSATHSL